MKSSCPVAMVELTHSLVSGCDGAGKDVDLHSGFCRDAAQKLMSQFPSGKPRRSVFTFEYCSRNAANFASIA